MQMKQSMKTTMPAHGLGPSLCSESRRHPCICLRENQVTSQSKGHCLERISVGKAEQVLCSPARAAVCLGGGGGVGHGDHPYMTSTTFWEFLTPSPPCPHLGLIFSTKFTQPPLLHLLLIWCSTTLPNCADIIYGCPLTRAAD